MPAQRNDPESVIRDIYAEWGRGNFRAGTEIYDPNVTVVLRPEFPDAGAYTGMEAVNGYMHRFLEPWTVITIQAEGVRVIGDSVLVEVLQRGTGMASGAETQLRYFQVWTFRGAKVIRIESIPSLDNAREALGITANIDLVRSIYAPWERGDFSSVEWAQADIDYVIADGPGQGRWRGLAGLSKGWAAWLSAWEDLRVKADEYRELDDERVLVISRYSGRGKTSGVDLEQMRSMGAILFHIRDEKVTRIVGYFELENALKALGPELAHAETSS